MRAAGLPAGIQGAVERTLGVAVLGARWVVGASISCAARVETAWGHRFVTWREGAPTGFNEAEVDGLRRLAATETVQVPPVDAVMEQAGTAILVMSYHPPAPADDDMMSAAGSQRVSSCGTFTQCWCT